jgi:hypothetical protein
MLRLDKTLRAWGTAGFDTVLKLELAQHADQLPLQQALAVSSSVADAPISVLIYQMQEQEESISIKAGIFYQGMVGGCSCADDPTPDSENTEFCILLLEIDRATAIATVSLLAE